MATNRRPVQDLAFLVAVSSFAWLQNASLVNGQSSPGHRAPPLLAPPANQLYPAQSSVATPAPTSTFPPSSSTLTGPSSLPETFTPSEEFQSWITELARQHLPDQYEKTKNWGNTTKVWDGLKVSLDEGRLETKRRWKQANDGTWYKYRVDVVDPEKHFEIRIHNIREIGGGKITADVQVLARLKCFGRMSQWEHGVQLVSLSADADTIVALSANLALGMQLDFSEPTPAVLLVPEVRSARIDLLDFRLQRVSNAKGPILKSLSSSVREVVEDRLEQQNRGKLAEKLNKQIAKQQDKLRLQLPDVAKSPWASLLPKEGSP